MVVSLYKLSLLLAAALPALAAPTQRSASEPKYIVTLRPDLAKRDVEAHLSWAADVHRRSLRRRDTSGVAKTFEIGSFHAYSGSFDEDTLAQLQASSDVLTVEKDAPVNLQAITQQPETNWGLGAISTRGELQTHGVWTHTYTYDERGSGEGMYAYVVDNGLYAQHKQFGGRASHGYNGFPDIPVVDINAGHSTHVAGIIGSEKWGVLKKVNMIGVKVFATNVQSEWSDVLAGFDWAVNNITATPGRLGKSVINLSLGGENSAAMDAAVEAAYKLGILSVVAAGNEERDARKSSPASAPNALTVGSIQRGYKRAEWSNFGPGIDVWAPGQNIMSTWMPETVGDQFDGMANMSGTSQATPHVTGLALYLMQVEGLTTPEQVTARILALGQKGLLKGDDLGEGSPNLLAFNGVA